MLNNWDWNGSLGDPVWDIPKTVFLSILFGHTYWDYSPKTNKIFSIRTTKKNIPSLYGVLFYTNGNQQKHMQGRCVWKAAFSFSSFSSWQFESCSWYFQLHYFFKQFNADIYRILGEILQSITYALLKSTQIYPIGSCTVTLVVAFEFLAKNFGRWRGC